MRLCRASVLLLPLLTLPLLVPADLTAQTLAAGSASLQSDDPLPTNPALRSLFLVGDATVSSSPGDASPAGEGWAGPLATLFDPAKINVVNRGIAGISSRTYIADGHWARTLALVKSGDVVLLQFGQDEPASNPAVPSTTGLPVQGSLPGIADTFREIAVPGTDQHGVVHTFGWYLREMVVETIARGATPILCSPAPSRDWQAGHIRQSADTYAGWAEAIALQQRIPFLDLNRILAAKYDSLGEAATAPLFDTAGTSTSPAGAVATAQVIIGALKGLRPDPLAGYFSQAAASIPEIAPLPPPTQTQPAPGLQPAP